ncbi:hypothetical protein SRRS_18750 [Sporomusa rhizae]|uniref:hypothetical protein n=1 Tax=Sporomusa rhizae TaxID=357999 RepID=UPI00352B8FBE
MEELLRQLVEGQKRLIAEVQELKDGQGRIEATMQAEFKSLKESDSAILGILEKTYRKVEEVEKNQDRMSESIRYLTRQSVQHDEDINRIRKAL